MVYYSHSLGLQNRVPLAGRVGTVIYKAEGAGNFSPVPEARYNQVFLLGKPGRV